MTKAEKAWLDAITALGCVVCIVDLGVYDSPAEPHHMLSGGRRKGHLFTIPLCPLHHRSGRNDKDVVSRDQNQKRFEARYGSEENLLAITKRLVSTREALKAPTTSVSVFHEAEPQHLVEER